MLRINVNLVTATVQETETLTSGRVGLQCGFTFSSEWDGLLKTATFEGAESADVAMLDGDVVTVPHECLSAPGAKLRVGVCGMNTDGDIVIPTIWANAGRIQQGAEPSGIPAEDPTPNWAAQVQEAAASALEIARNVKAEADNGDFDGQDGTSPTATVVRGDSSATITITDANGTTSVEIYDGQTGETGETGPRGNCTWVAVTQPEAYETNLDDSIKSAEWVIADLQGPSNTPVKVGDTILHAGYWSGATYLTTFQGVYVVSTVGSTDVSGDREGSLIGPKGDTGSTGAAATIAAGTTTTGAAGTNASVTNAGTSSAAVFNFTIPKGDKGDTGDSGVYYGSSTPTDPDVEVWIDPSGTNVVHEVPSGGSSGQVLAKASGTDYDVGWITPSAGSSDLYWCTYSTTTSAQIEAALAADQIPVVLRNDVLYVYAYKASATKHYFGSTGLSSLSYQYLIEDNGSWSSASLLLVASEVTNSTTGSVSQALDAGKIYHFTGALTGLTITLNAANGIPAQYHFDFDEPSTAFTPSFPNTVTLPTGQTWEASTHYEVDILNGYAAVMAW